MICVRCTSTIITDLATRSRKPGDFDYKVESQQYGMLVVARLLTAKFDVMQELERILSAPLSGNRTSSCFFFCDLSDWSQVETYSPIAILRPIFLQLRSPTVFTSLIDRIVHLLSFEMPMSQSIDIGSPVDRSLPSPEVRIEFRRSLMVSLYSDEYLSILRLRFCIGLFCQV